jgi:Flp pilus assembly protein TadB
MFTSPLGWAILVLAAILLLIGNFAIRRLTRIA